MKTLIILIILLTGCKKITEGEPRKIYVTWSDTVNYRGYLGEPKHCATPQDQYYVTVASGQNFVFDVSSADTACVSAFREYEVTVKQEKKIIYQQRGFRHNIKIPIH